MKKMKKTLFTIAILLAAITTNAQEAKFEEETIDFGEIAKGSNGTRIFEFTNVGDAPLIIKTVQSTCGCTIPKKPEKEIMPNEKGSIAVSYDTNRIGRFSKSVTVYSNGKSERKILRIKGNVVIN